MPESVNIIRTLIVDDEPLAREGLKILLEDFEVIQVSGECSNGEDALKFISEQEIELIFLDIQMPSMTGIEMVEKLRDLSTMPRIIFVTAYDEYAVKAFEFHAIDYLLKPIDREMVFRSVSRVVEQIKEDHQKIEFDQLKQMIESILKPKETPFGAAKKIPVKADGKVRYIYTNEIPIIEANGDYINVYHFSKSYLVHDRLKRLESDLKSAGFIRIHRSYLINTSCVKSIENESFGEYVFTFENCSKKVRSSRGYSKNVHRFMDALDSRN